MDFFALTIFPPRAIQMVACHKCSFFSIAVLYPECDYTTACLTINPLKDIWVVSECLFVAIMNRATVNILVFC